VNKKFNEVYYSKMIALSLSLKILPGKNLKIPSYAISITQIHFYPDPVVLCFSTG
jgi:hypothetical protein